METARAFILINVGRLWGKTPVLHTQFVWWFEWGCRNGAERKGSQVMGIILFIYSAVTGVLGGCNKSFLWSELLFTFRMRFWWQWCFSKTVWKENTNIFYLTYITGVRKKQSLRYVCTCKYIMLVYLLLQMFTFVYSYLWKSIYIFTRVVSWNQRQEQLRSTVWTRRQGSGQPEWPENTRTSSITKEYDGNAPTQWLNVQLWNSFPQKCLIRPCVWQFQCLEECDSHGLPPTEQGRLDLELKIEDTKENMRKAEVCTIPLQLRQYKQHIPPNKHRWHWLRWSIVKALQPFT